MVVFTRALLRRARILIVVGIAGIVGAVAFVTWPQIQRLQAPPHSEPQFVMPDRIAVQIDPPPPPLHCVHTPLARAEARSP